MPVLGEAAHHVEDLADQLGVERRRRLVEEHELGLHRQRPRDRDALLLAAGELVRVDVDLVGEPDPGEQRSPALLGRRARLTLDANRRFHDVLERGHVREAG